MPSFWEHTRLDVPHVPGVATRVSTRSIGIICHIDPHAAPPADAAGQPPDTPRTPPDTQGATSLLSRIPLYFSILSWGSETRTVPKGRADRWERIFLVKTPFRSGKNSSPVQSYDLERDLHLSG